VASKESVVSLRGLLVLLILLAAAVFAYHRVARRPASPVPPADAPLLPAFTEDAVQQLELTCGAATTTLRRISPRSWRLSGPLDAEADPRRVHEVVAALQDARVRKVIADGKPDPAGYGLAPAACTVRLDLGVSAKPTTLRLGRGSPVGSERYAATDEARVVLTEGTLYGVVSKPADEFREHRLFPVDSSAITKVTLERPADRVTLDFIDGGCRLASPVPDAGSSSACASFTRALASFEVTESTGARPPAESRVDRRFKLTVEAQGASSPLVAYVATAGIDGKRLAWREGAALSGLLAESSAHELERSVDSFRDLRILSFSSPDVRKLAVDRAGRTFELARSAEASPWKGAEGTASFAVDGARVDALLDTLRGLTGASFATAPPPSGMTASLVVSGEKGELARLAFGPLPRAAGALADELWVTTPARPGVVFRLAASAMGAVPNVPGDLAAAKP
jgi:Domain of unknown function (DUF4340)